MKHKAIFDGRNLFDMNAMKELGFHYESMGRATVQHGKSTTMEEKRVLITGAAGFWVHICATGL